MKGTTRLNKIIKEDIDSKRVMITGDYHIPFMDEKAYKLTMAYAKIYKPDIFVINGDLIDFYSLSLFDKNPERLGNLQDDLDHVKDTLLDIRRTLPDAEIIYLEGNHTTRLQKYLWRHPELHGLKVLKIENLLDLKNVKIKYIGASPDYWKTDTGHYAINDIIIMHGDNRLNGACYSKYSGYSAKNTITTLQTSTIMGHTHRLAMIFHSSPYQQFIGIEGGCLCQKTGTSNWQQGFITFEYIKDNNINYKIHQIEDGMLIEDGYVLK